MKQPTLRTRSRFAQVFGGNPLVRPGDRLEAVFVLLLVTVALVAVPFAGAFGTSVHEGRQGVYDQQARSRHSVEAVATAHSTAAPQGYSVQFTVPVRWQTGGGTRTDTIRWDRPVQAGQPLAIWVSADGRYAGPPTRPGRAGADAIAAAIGAWFGVVILCILAFAAVRIRLTRAHARAWDQELRLLVDDGGGRAAR